jgi:hypothetical protein
MSPRLCLLCSGTDVSPTDGLEFYSMWSQTAKDQLLCRVLKVTL